MAVDKKSDHVGNHGGTYTDQDGQSRQFTYIDHDVKSTISSQPKLTNNELSEIRKQLREYRESLIEEILAIPASFCPFVLERFTIRGDRERIEWNETMLRDEGLDLERLREIRNLSSR